MVLFPTPFYFVYYISNLLSYIQNNFSYELARPIMGTIFLVILLRIMVKSSLVTSITIVMQVTCKCIANIGVEYCDLLPG